MKKLLYIIAFIGLFHNQAYAQPDFSGLIEIQPNPAMEGQIVRIGFISGCRNWSDHSFSVDGFDINYEVTYLPCVIGVPTPEFFVYYDLGELPAGDYQLNMTIIDGFVPQIQYQEIINFGVLPIKQVPINSTLSIISLFLIILVSGTLYRYSAHTQLSQLSPGKDSEP